MAEVVIEPIVQGAEDDVDPTASASYEKTPSLIDRSVEPPYGATPALATPDVWQTETENGISVYGISDSELPLVQFSMVVEGGHLLDTPETAGTANLLAEILTKGTATKTPAEFDNALALLGAEVDVFVTTETFEISGETLARNLDATMALITEALLEPRWDETEFDLAVSRTRDAIQAGRQQPNTIAGRAFNWVTYGPGSMRSMSTLGSERNLETITIEDLQAWKQNYLTPQLSSLRIVGNVDEADVLAALDELTEQWQPVDVTLPEPEQAVTPTGSKVYFYDVPGASQSVFRFGYPALKRTDEQYDVTGVMNYRLGGGGFASRLTQELREGKGYTYGIGSSFSGTDQVGTFGIFSGVRSNVTLEAASLVRDIMRDYAATYTQNDLDVTQSFFTKSQARRFESLGAKLNVLSDIADYDLPYDYVAQQIEKVEALTVEDMQALAADNIRPDAMNYIIVGDAETQLPRLADLGFGEPVLINEEIDSLTE